MPILFDVMGMWFIALLTSAPLMIGLKGQFRECWAVCALMWVFFLWLFGVFWFWNFLASVLFTFNYTGN